MGFIRDAFAIHTMLHTKTDCTQNMRSMRSNIRNNVNFILIGSEDTAQPRLRMPITL